MLTPYDSPKTTIEPETTTTKTPVPSYSFLGIISFVFGLAGAIGLLLFIFMGEMIFRFGMEKPIFGSILALTLLALITGIGALFQKKRRRLFPVLGILFSTPFSLIILRLLFDSRFFHKIKEIAELHLSPPEYALAMVFSIPFCLLALLLVIVWHNNKLNRPEYLGDIFI